MKDRKLHRGKWLSMFCIFAMIIFVLGVMWITLDTQSGNGIYIANTGVEENDVINDVSVTNTDTVFTLAPGEVLAELTYGSNGTIVVGATNISTANLVVHVPAVNPVNGAVILSIAANAFMSKTNIVRLDLSDANNLQSIGGNAFSRCSNMSGNIVLPNSLLTIGSASFSGCKKLSGDLTIPNSVTSIGFTAFKTCSGLRGSLVLGSGLTVLENAVFSDAGFTGSLVIPDNIVQIGQSVFMNCKFTGSLTLSHNIKEISAQAFRSAGFSGDLVIGDNVVNIGSRAFDTCKFNGTISIGNNVEIISDRAFYNCGSLKGDLILPDSLITLGDTAFYRCTNLKGSVKLGNNVESIGESAFKDCGFKGELIIPSTLEKILKNTFNGCKNLSGKLIIPEGVKSIDYDAFAYTDFSSAVIASSVTSISKNIFRSCYSIKSIEMLQTSKLTKLDDAAFNTSTNMKPVVVFQNVEVYKHHENITNTTTTYNLNLLFYHGSNIEIEYQEKLYGMPMNLQKVNGEWVAGAKLPEFTPPLGYSYEGWSSVPSGDTANVTADTVIDFVKLSAVLKPLPAIVIDTAPLEAREYDGKSIAYQINGQDAGLGDFTINYIGLSFSGESYNSVTSPTNAGTYSVHILRDATTTHSKYEINIADALIITPLMVEIIIDNPDQVFVYNGLDQSEKVTATVSRLIHNDSVNVALTINDGMVFINAGSYLFNSVLDNQNYAISSDKQFEYVINKMDATVGADSFTIEYGQELPIFTATYTGLVNNENNDVLGVLLYSTTYDKENNANVGEYDIVLSGLSSINYNIEYLNAKLTVSKAKVQVVFSGLVDGILDEDVVLTATFVDVNGASIDLVISYDKDILLGAGEYVATATCIDTNYELVGNTVSFVIESQVPVAIIVGSIFGVLLLILIIILAVIFMKKRLSV